MGAFLTYALDESGVLVQVDDVAKGSKCGCHCPHCEAPLYAKNAGLKRMHHFAHARGFECEGAYETSLHLLAKEVLQESGRLMLPSSEDDSFPYGSVSLHHIESEKWDSRYGIRPDVEGILDNGERLLIEFYVSHRVDSKKRQVIVDNKLKCIEIDINYLSLDKDELRHYLCESDEGRKWITQLPYHQTTGISHYYERKPIYDKTRDKLKEVFDNETIMICPGNDGVRFNLREYGYDICEVNTRFRRFKSDLLLFRSKMAYHGPISINVRGRKRNSDFRVPTGLRIIDFVIKSDILDLSIGPELSNSYNITVYYYGFKYEEKSRLSSQRIDYQELEPLLIEPNIWPLE